MYRIVMTHYEGNRKPTYPISRGFKNLIVARKYAIGELQNPDGKYYYAKLYRINDRTADTFAGEVHMHAIDGPRWYPAVNERYTSGKYKLNRNGTVKYRIE